MPLQIAPLGSHPEGESKTTLLPGALGDHLPDRLPVDTLGGRVYVEWDPDAPVTPMGQLVFFTQFLQTSGRFEAWVKDCPWSYTSPNAPKVRDVLGTVLLSVLAGHHRYAHVSALRGDTVNPPLLNMSGVVSEDSVRQALRRSRHEPAQTEQVFAWQRRHLYESYAPLLSVPWILDIDSTIKPIYGHQQGAEIGYNPHKPGRPSHVYHSYLMGSARLVLDVEVQPGKQTATHHALPGLWRLIEALPASARPYLVRGDCHFGNERVLSEAESRSQNYLFKLRLTRKPQDLIRLLETQGAWVDAGQGWQGQEAQLQLQGWSRARRVIVLRRRLDSTARPVAASLPESGSTLFLPWPEASVCPSAPEYEYAVLVTSLAEEILALAQLYRDRGDAENNFDELKNQWGWAGFTTRDLLRCQITARTIALVYNWWSLFARLADPSLRREAITSRPLLLHAVARSLRHGGQTTVVVTSAHAEASKIREMMTQLSQFLSELKATAEQLTDGQRWCRILSKIFEPLLKGKILTMPVLATASG